MSPTDAVHYGLDAHQRTAEFCGRRWLGSVALSKGQRAVNDAFRPRGERSWLLIEQDFRRPCGKGREQAGEELVCRVQRE